LYFYWQIFTALIYGEKRGDSNAKMEKTNPPSSEPELPKNKKIEKQIESALNHLKAIQTNPALRKDYKKAIEELIKLRRQQTRAGRTKDDDLLK
jgi:hypothetical protein